MKLSLDSLYRSAIELVDKTPLRRLTEQQKKITLIASLALSLLAAAYLIYRCCFKASKDSELPVKNGESAVETVQSSDKNEEEPVGANEPVQPKEPQRKTEDKPARVVNKTEDKELPTALPKVDVKPADPSEEIDDLNSEGERLREEHKLEEAAILFEKVLAKDPDNLFALSGLADILRRRRNTSKPWPNLKKCSQKNQNILCSHWLWSCAVIAQGIPRGC